MAGARIAGACRHSAERRVPTADVGHRRAGSRATLAGAQAAYDQLANLSAVKARARIVELLKESGDLIGDPRPITHPVKFYEKGDRPLEIVTSRQWFIKTMEFREELLARGAELQWHPEYMRHRYENWVNGLAGDWCVSRQRFFGVPFPVWYPIDGDGQVDYARPIVPKESQLPIDPSTDTPEGYTASQRNQPNGFAGDPDIMDTWATSSVTPQIAGDWLGDPDLFARVFPMDLRPQAHEIIRTWLFDTVLRSTLEHGSLPWKHTAISGWVLDPDRKKMSKSKGNVVTPMALLEEHGSDGVRYWAASGRPGTDTAFDPGQMKVGRRLAIKMLNAAKFALMQAEPRGPITEPLDRGMLSSLSTLVRESTEQLEAYDYARVLEQAERFFWSFCDDYLELVKGRRYGDFTPEGAASANSAMLVALSALLRLFAPFLPFVTEEVWSWWRPGSVHNAKLADGRGGRGADRWPRRARGPGVRADACGARGDSADQGAGEEAGQGGHRSRRSAAAFRVAGACVTGLQGGRAHPGPGIRTGRGAAADVCGRANAGTTSVNRPLHPVENRSLSTTIAISCAARWPRTSAAATSRRREPSMAAGACTQSCWRSRAASSPDSTLPSRRFVSSIPSIEVTVHHRGRLAVRARHDGGGDQGRADALLIAERTALNFMQRLSGIATLTRQFVDAAAGRIIVLDTRKTTPLMRVLEKYAVRAGGGTNHRFGLDDGILIKDNHVRLAGGVGAAVQRMRDANQNLPVEVEAQSLCEVDAALEAGADIVLLDNLSTADIIEAVGKCRGKARTEISGGVTLARMPELAATGADYVSIGALTHSAPAADLSFEIEMGSGVI